MNAIDLRSLGTGQPIAVGRDCFKSFFKDFENRFSKRKEEAPNEPDITAIETAYNEFFDAHQADVGHYFRSLYNIVKFIHRSELGDKRMYTNLVRAQLSSYEQVLLVYNCLTPFGSSKFKPLIEEYGLFKNLPLSLLIDEQHKMFYAARAFA